MQTRMKLIWIVLLLVGLSLACQAVSDLTVSPTATEAPRPTRVADPTAPPLQVEPTAEPVVVETEPPPPTAAVQPTQPLPTVTTAALPPAVNEILFEDDFSDPDSGWDRVNRAEGITDYASGQYRILVDKEMSDYWANPGLYFWDVRVEVEATKVGGPDDNDFGLICRYQDIDNFYYFLISSDGYYSINRMLNGDSIILGAETMLTSSAIFQGPATNFLRADCVDDLLTLYVNDVYLTSVSDWSFAAGDVGLIAGTFGISGTDIYFDNFVVRVP